MSASSPRSTGRTGEVSGSTITTETTTAAQVHVRQEIHFQGLLTDGDADVIAERLESHFRSLSNLTDEDFSLKYKVTTCKIQTGRYGVAPYISICCQNMVGMVRLIAYRL